MPGVKPGETRWPLPLCWLLFCCWFLPLGYSAECLFSPQLQLCSVLLSCSMVSFHSCFWPGDVDAISDIWCGRGSWREWSTWLLTPLGPGFNLKKIDYHLGKGVGCGVQYGATEYYRKKILCVAFCRTRFFLGWLRKNIFFR